MSSQLLLNGTATLIELSWKFIGDHELKANSLERGGIAIKGSSATQFAAGDGKNGVIALPAWVAGEVKNGIAILPLPGDKCWVCAVLSGLIAPDSDHIIEQNKLPVILEMIEDVVPDERFLIRANNLSLDADAIVDYDSLQIPAEFIHAKELLFTKSRTMPHIKGFRKSQSSNMVRYTLAATMISMIITGIYYGYDWWQKEQIAKQRSEVNVEIQQNIQRELQHAQDDAEQYRDTHQAMNMYMATKNITQHFAVNESGWRLQGVVINHQTRAKYKRENGLLAPFLKNKEDISWSADGETAVLSRDLIVDLPVPIHSYNLMPMSKIKAISLMQKIHASGIESGLLADIPAWAASAPEYALTSGFSSLYWKVSVPMSHFKSVLSLLQSPNIAVGEITLNVIAKECFIEGRIYVSHG